MATKSSVPLLWHTLFSSVFFPVYFLWGGGVTFSNRRKKATQDLLVEYHVALASTRELRWQFSSSYQWKDCLKNVLTVFKCDVYFKYLSKLTQMNSLGCGNESRQFLSIKFGSFLLQLLLMLISISVPNLEYKGKLFGALSLQCTLDWITLPIVHFGVFLANCFRPLSKLYYSLCVFHLTSLWNKP